MNRLAKKLKNMSWKDNWKNYILYRQEHEPEPVVVTSVRQLVSMPGTPMPDIQVLDLIERMEELNGKMSVYKAFLKGIEYLFSQNYPYFNFEELKRLKKIENKNLTEGIYDKELSDYIKAGSKGYIKWHAYNENIRRHMNKKQRRLETWSKVSQFTSSIMLIEVLPFLIILIAEQKISGMYAIILGVTMPILLILTIISDICETKFIYEKIDLEKQLRNDTEGK